MIEFREVSKVFGDFQVLEGIDFFVDEGEVVVVIGPSGSGKSTLLRCINGLEEISSGEFVVDGMRVGDRKTDLNTLRTEIGMVFQQFNLYPHMTVAENIKLAPMKVKSISRREADKRCSRLLERVGIPEQADKYPESLSGGQQQRVAIACGLAGAQDHALRRAHERARPRDDQRGARGDGRSGEGRHDDGRRNPRDGFRKARGRPGGLHGRGPHSRGGPPEHFFENPENERTKRFLNQILH